MLDLNTSYFLFHTLSTRSENKITSVGKRDLYAVVIELVKVGQKETRERGRYIDVVLDLQRKRFPERSLYLGSSKIDWRLSTETAGLDSPSLGGLGASFVPALQSDYREVFSQLNSSPA